MDIISEITSAVVGEHGAEFMLKPGHDGRSVEVLVDSSVVAKLSPLADTVETEGLVGVRKAVFVDVILRRDASDRLTLRYQALGMTILPTDAELLAAVNDVIGTVDGDGMMPAELEAAGLETARVVKAAVEARMAESG